jgi:hypothetical protein
MTPWLRISKFNQNFNETLEIYEEAIQLVEKVKCVGTLCGVVEGNMKLVQ